MIKKKKGARGRRAPPKKSEPCRKAAAVLQKSPHRLDSRAKTGYPKRDLQKSGNQKVGEQSTLETILSLCGIRKQFDGVEVLKGIDLDVRKGEFLTFLGPSGCGKTTTLRIIAGLEAPDAGRVLLNGEDVTDLPPNKRNVNTIFQNYALFPHMNVAANIAYPLKLQHRKKPDIQACVADLLDLVQLSEFGGRRPDELSGGQRQRVAIARALAAGGDVLLLDEPLGALDLQLRRQMQRELKALQKRLGRTFLYITHDQEEAINMSDRIAVLHEGRLEQLGTPQEIYDRPKTRFVAGFIGQANLFSAEEAGAFEDGVVRLALDGGVGEALAHDGAHELHACEQVSFCVRSEHIKISETPVPGFSIAATVRDYSYLGGMLRIVLALSDGREILCANRPDGSVLSAGGRVWVFWDPKNAVFLDRPDGAPEIPRKGARA